MRGRPDRHTFETVDSTLIHQGAVLALRVDSVTMPGGRVAQREVVEHQGGVAVVALDDAGLIVLIEQYRHPIGSRLLELPAGLLDVAGEDPLAAAQRELAEEAALAAARWSLLVDVAASPGFTDETVRVYLAEGLSSAERDAPVHEEADIEQVRMDVSSAVSMVLAGRIINPAAVAGILALAALRSEPGLTQRPIGAPWESRPTAFARRKNAPGG